MLAAETSLLAPLSSSVPILYILVGFMQHFPYCTHPCYMQKWRLTPIRASMAKDVTFWQTRSHRRINHSACIVSRKLSDHDSYCLSAFWTKLKLGRETGIKKNNYRLAKHLQLNNYNYHYCSINREKCSCWLRPLTPSPDMSTGSSSFTVFMELTNIMRCSWCVSSCCRSSIIFAIFVIPSKGSCVNQHIDEIKAQKWART